MKLRKNKNQPTSRRIPGNQPNASAYSYYSNRSSSDSNTKRLSKNVRKRFNWQLIPTFIAAGAILVSLLYMSTLDTAPILKIKGAKESPLLQDEAVYSSESQRLLQESIYNRSKLFIDSKDLEAKMRDKFPELKTVSIAVPLTSRNPIVTVEAVDPTLMLASAKGTYLIDSRGRAVLKVEDVSTYNVPVVSDETGLEIQIGKIALSARDTTFLAELNHQLAAKAVVIQSTTLPAIANEVHVRVQDESYYVKFNLLGDARLQAGGYLALLERLQKDGIMPSEYVDVRVEEKAFYR